MSQAVKFYYLKELKGKKWNFEAALLRYNQLGSPPKPKT